LSSQHQRVARHSIMPLHRCGIVIQWSLYRIQRPSNAGRRCGSASLQGSSSVTSQPASQQARTTDGNGRDRSVGAGGGNDCSGRILAKYPRNSICIVIHANIIVADACISIRTLNRRIRATILNPRTINSTTLRSATTTTTMAARRPGGRRGRRCRAPAPSRTSAASPPTQRCGRRRTATNVEARPYDRQRCSLGRRPRHVLLCTVVTPSSAYHCVAMILLKSRKG